MFVPCQENNICLISSCFVDSQHLNSDLRGATAFSKSLAISSAMSYIVRWETRDLSRQLSSSTGVGGVPSRGFVFEGSMGSSDVESLRIVRESGVEVVSFAFNLDDLAVLGHE